MNFTRRSPRRLVITALIAVLAGAVVVLGRPRPVSNPVLGVGWACSQTAFVVTTCAPTQRQPAAVETSSKNSIHHPPRV